MENNCTQCQGTGVVAYSCCGDVIYDDTELCPTCKEFIGYEEEECECKTSIKKQTPVEWLVEQYIDGNYDPKVYEKALQMEAEKQQKYNEMLEFIQRTMYNEHIPLAHRKRAQQLIKEATEQ